MVMLHSICAVRCKSGSPRPRDAMDRTHMPAISTVCDGYLAFAHLLAAAWAAKVAIDPA
jgi:hypothetical protein